MDKSNILESTIQIILNLLENKNLIITEYSSSENIAEWDSLKHILIINEVEKKFNLNFDIDDILDLQTVADIVNKIFELKNENNRN
jgi:acyl carrier protein